MRNPHRRHGGLPALVLGFGSLALLIGCLADSAVESDEMLTAEQPPEPEVLPPEPEPTPPMVLAQEEPFVWDKDARVVRGDFAPDFELPRLKFSENAAGDPIGIISEDDKYLLSSRFGDRPICMFMSSFT